MLKETFGQACSHFSSKGNTMENTANLHQNELFFTESERNGLYKTIFNRRDVRGQFKPDPIPDDVLSRVLYAAHHAPSVGFMQPWNFVVVRDDAVKQKVHHAFVEANNEAAEMFEPEKSEVYRSLKLEGILDVRWRKICARTNSGTVKRIVIELCSKGVV